LASSLTQASPTACRQPREPSATRSARVLSGCAVCALRVAAEIQPLPWLDLSDELVGLHFAAFPSVRAYASSPAKPAQVALQHCGRAEPRLGRVEG
jgi:hypothetical protein